MVLQSRNPERVLESTGNTMLVTEQKHGPEIHEKWNPVLGQHAKVGSGDIRRCQSLKNSVESDLVKTRYITKFLLWLHMLFWILWSRIPM